MNDFNIFDLIIGLTLLFFSIVIHECAHGWMAEKRGDPTARMLGRITLNPIKHIDPLGTLILPIMLNLMGGPIFGWAKPVPVNYYNLNHPRKDMILVAIAGPISNILLATGALFILVFTSRLASFIPSALVTQIYHIAVIFIVLNVLLAIFNMIPIPPLDGSRVASGLLPMTLAEKYSKLEPFGFFIIFGLLYLNAFSWMFRFAQLVTINIIQFVIN